MPHNETALNPNWPSHPTCNISCLPFCAPRTTRFRGSLHFLSSRRLVCSILILLSLRLHSCSTAIACAAFPGLRQRIQVQCVDRHIASTAACRPSFIRIVCPS